MFNGCSTALALAAMLALAVPANAEDLRAEVIHWWTSGGESAAVKVFADQFQAAGGTWVDTAIAGGANARTAAINRTVGGNPPTAMQLNTGKRGYPGRGAELELDSTACFSAGGHPQRPRIRRARKHSRAELVVLLHRGIGEVGCAAAYKLGRSVSSA